MTYKDIADMIDEMGLSFTYYSFPIGEAPSLPYIVFYYPSNDDFGADNKNYVPIVNLNIELYTENKDFSTEQTVEDVLEAHDIFFSKTETYLTSEEMYEVLYEMQIAIEKETNG
jgi:hypothetical protein